MYIYIYLLSRPENGSWLFLAGGMPAMVGVGGGGGVIICAIGVVRLYAPDLVESLADSLEHDNIIISR